MSITVELPGDFGARKSDWTDSAFGSGWFGRWTDEDMANAALFIDQWRDELQRAEEVANGTRGGTVARVQSELTSVNEIIDHLQAFIEHEVPGAGSLQADFYDVQAMLAARLDELEQTEDDWGRGG